MNLDAASPRYRHVLQAAVVAAIVLPIIPFWWWALAGLSGEAGLASGVTVTMVEIALGAFLISAPDAIKIAEERARKAMVQIGVWEHAKGLHEAKDGAFHDHASCKPVYMRRGDR